MEFPQEGILVKFPLLQGVNRDLLLKVLEIGVNLNSRVDPLIALCDRDQVIIALWRYYCLRDLVPTDDKHRHKEDRK